MSREFEFLRDLSPYGEKPGVVARLEQRHRLIIDPFLPQIRDAEVLDLACHDGRWSYALAQAGARKVVGVEARQDLVDRFAFFPEGPVKDRVEVSKADIFDDLEARIARQEAFDVVALYGIFYHVMDHYRLLSLISHLKPKLIIIDSEFITVANAMIQVLREETSNPLNAVTKVAGMRSTVVGVPSYRAMEFMAEALGYDLTWMDAGLILGEARKGMADYFRGGRKVRATCALTRP